MYSVAEVLQIAWNIKKVNQSRKIILNILKKATYTYYGINTFGML
jgi:histidine ammonia-lyase